MYTIKENFGPINRSIRDYEKIAVKTVDGIIMERKNYTISHNNQPIVTFVSAIANDSSFNHVVDHIESTYDIKVHLDSESGGFNSLRLTLNGKRIRVGTYSMDLWIDADKYAFTAVENYFKQLSNAIEKLISMSKQIPDGIQDIRKPGRKFYKRAILLASLSGYNITKEELQAKHTKRAIVNFIEDLLADTYLGGFEQHLLDNLKSEANKDPLICNTLGGVYFSNVLVDVNTIHTDDPQKVLDIVNECCSEDAVLYYKCVKTTTYETTRSMIEIDENHYVDCITIGGVRIDYDVDGNSLQQMVYIPGKLFCYASLYKNVTAKINILE